MGIYYLRTNHDVAARSHPNTTLSIRGFLH